MGTRAALNDANVCMGQLEDRFFYRTPWYNHIIHWISFINDMFLIWKGRDSDSLNTFIEYLNSVVLSIKFTREMSSTTMNFLDDQIKVMEDSNGNRSTDVYQKPTDTHPCLHWTSAHPPLLKHSILYSQPLRFRKICTSAKVLEQRIR